MRGYQKLYAGYETHVYGATHALIRDSCQKGCMLRSGLVRERQLARRPGVDDPRAMLLLCYQNIEPPVKIPKGALRSGAPVMAAFSAAKKAGVEFWQVCSRTHVACGESQRSYTSMYDIGISVARCCWPLVHAILT